MFAPESTYFPELFAPNVRYGGASFGFQASAAIGWGSRPFHRDGTCSLLGGTGGVSIMLVLLALVTLAAALFAGETKNDALLKQSRNQEGKTKASRAAGRHEHAAAGVASFPAADESCMRCKEGNLNVATKIMHFASLSFPVKAIAVDSFRL
jgi:hypothetical protein